jgi:transposase
VVCRPPDGTLATQVRTFGSMTGELAALARWLGDWQVEHVAMESSGGYWWPVFKLLEEAGQSVLLVTPRHMKAIPGRKTAVGDSRWLADLLRHGLLRARVIPPAAMRELTRERKALVRERTPAANRLRERSSKRPTSRWRGW